MTQPLRRAMGLRHATAMVAGIILGASIFVQPAEFRLPSGNVGYTAPHLPKNFKNHAQVVVCRGKRMLR